jgi:DnaJ domain
MPCNYIFQCKFCHGYIYLDNTRLSESGKRIPLDTKTKEIHNCQELANKVFNCRDCNKPICFSIYDKSKKTGKMIPLNPKTRSHHRCKAKPFNRETRRAWWYKQQWESEARREENKQSKKKGKGGVNRDSSRYPEYCRTLQVGLNATEEQIKDSWRKLALQFHPDRMAYSDNEITWDNANQKFKQINEAYENLID